jgi:hypothetical protein
MTMDRSRSTHEYTVKLPCTVDGTPYTIEFNVMATSPDGALEAVGNELLTRKRCSNVEDGEVRHVFVYEDEGEFTDKGPG